MTHTTYEPGTHAAAAMARLQQFINRSAGAHQRAMRAKWQLDAATAHQADDMDATYAAREAADRAAIESMFDAANRAHRATQAAEQQADADLDGPDDDDDDEATARLVAMALLLALLLTCSGGIGFVTGYLFHALRG